ncbi:hypothetical protein BT69DRAFT_215181 [Atractiella rhizophila]|nr:hypothetical protein BT69DRAFT_215181 [Atractiella rhizophila]
MCDASHIHDHYRILLSSLGAAPAAREIPVNYDERHLSRPTELEISVPACIKAYNELKKQLEALLSSPPSLAERTIKLAAVTPERVEMHSTVARELWFASHHAIHHYSLARVIITQELGVKVGDDFGVAPSTIVSRGFREGAKL